MDNERSTNPLEDLWGLALIDLQAQMGQSTFDTWLKGTEPLYLEKGKMVVGTGNNFAVEWLNNRLKNVVEATLIRHGHTGGVTFAYSPPTPIKGAAKEDDGLKSYALIELMDFDPTTLGAIEVPKYALQFWQPYLGHGPFNLWQTIRSFGKKNDLSLPIMPSIGALTIICAGGNKQNLIGRNLKGGKRKVGWIETLEQEKILTYKRKREQYIFRILDRLPLLTPSQVQKLPRLSQEAHREFLNKAKVDQLEWEQLTVSTLSKGVAIATPSKKTSKNYG